MTGISKNLYKFSSLMAAVALFLGLMVTGCSEGDNAPDKEILYDATKTKVDVVVGLEDEAEDADGKISKKGYEVPANVALLVVKLMNGEDLVPLYEQGFAEKETGEVAAWTEEDGKITMPMVVDKDAVEDIASVVVTSYDGEGNLLGAYCWDGASLNAPVDFTKDDAPAFQDAAELAENSVMTLTTEPEAVDDVVTIAVDETATVHAEAVIALSEATSIEEEIADEALVLTLAEDTTALTIEGNEVTGVEETSNPVEVLVAAGELTASFSVQVGEGPIVGGLTLTADPEEIAVDETSQLTAMYGDADVTADCTFETSDEAIATVDETGLVTGVADGEVTITATYTAEGEEEPATAEVTITVTGDEPTTELTASADAEVIDIDGTAQITAMYGEDDVTADCTFETSDEAIATVDETGLVTGVADGEVTITVSYTPEGAEEALTAEVAITVSAE